MTQTAQYPDLQGASVFITGGGSGIGASLTEGFLRQGAKVAFVQRSDSTEFCDQMEADTGTRPLFIPCDITDTARLNTTPSARALRAKPPASTSQYRQSQIPATKVSGKNHIASQLMLSCRVMKRLS